MPKMICCKCQVELKIEKNGVSVVEMFSKPSRPYKIWSADSWKCPKCSNEIIAGFGMQPISEHFQDDFTGILKRVVSSGNVHFVYEK